MSCRWVASDQPRVIHGRHLDPCVLEEHGLAEACKGCQPCTEPHCRVCGVRHDEGACPECRDEVRDNLADILDRSLALGIEVTAKGVDSEAMMLNTPTAHPEQWRQRGRYGHLYPFEARLGENHPLWVLATWEQVYRDEMGHHTHERSTIASAREYLDRNLAYFAGYHDVPFEAFATDVRTCLSHLEAVLHDQSQGDRANVNCFECGSQLERKLVESGFEDYWTCRGCRRRYTYPEYNFALRAKLETALAEKDETA